MDFIFVHRLYALFISNEASFDQYTLIITYNVTKNGIKKRVDKNINSFQYSSHSYLQRDQ
jgi:hypothetical protein